MQPITIIDSNVLSLTLNRLCRQIIENHNDFSQTVLLGLQPRGIYLAERISDVLLDILNIPVPCGKLDITFHRDDFRRTENPLKASDTKIDFSLENKKVILIDDVLYTGRTVRAGLDAMLAFGRPQKVELLVLIDRRFSRELPIKPKYIGKSIDSIDSQRVKVNWKGVDEKTEDEVILLKH